LATFSALRGDLRVLNKLVHSIARSTLQDRGVKSELATFSRCATSIQRGATEQQSQQQQARRVEIDVHNNKSIDARFGSCGLRDQKIMLKKWPLFVLYFLAGALQANIIKTIFIP
jgi:hypothetical protein